MSAEQKWTVVNDDKKVYVFGGFKQRKDEKRKVRCLVFKRAVSDETLQNCEVYKNDFCKVNNFCEEIDDIDENRQRELIDLGKTGKKSSSTSSNIYYALIGVFIVWRFPSLVVVKERKPVGVHFGEYIFEAKKIDLVPLFNIELLTKKESKKFLQYKRYFKQHTKRMHLYYSYLGNIVQSTRSIIKSKLGPKQNLSDGSDVNVSLNDFLIDKMSLTEYEKLINHKYTYNLNILKNIIYQVRDKTSFVILTCGAIKQTYIHTSNGLNIFSIIMKKSRYFVGPRFRKRGISPGCDVANDVETEVTIYRPYPMHPNGYYSSYLIYRGSVPAIWSQHAAFTQATPPFIIPEDKFQNNFISSVRHLQALVKEYDDVIVLSLLKSGVKNKENALAILLDKCVGHYNAQTEMKDMTETCKNAATVIGRNNDYNYHNNNTAYYYGNNHVSEVIHLDVSNIKRKESRSEYDLTLRTVLAHIASLNSFTNLRVLNGGTMKINSIQKSVTRVNCVDCLDRTNDAQMILTVSNTCSMLLANEVEARETKTFSIPEQIKYYITGPQWVYEPVTSGVLPQNTKDTISSIFKKCGDAISYEYCGSQAHDKSVNAKKGKAAILNLQRHIDSNFTARDEQIAADVFHGLFNIDFSTGIDVWDIDDANEKLLHLHGSMESFRTKPDITENTQSPTALVSPLVTPEYTEIEIEPRTTKENLLRDYTEFLKPGGRYTLLEHKSSSSSSSSEKISPDMVSEYETFPTSTDKKTKQSTIEKDCPDTNINVNEKPEQEQVEQVQPLKPSGTVGTTSFPLLEALMAGDNDSLARIRAEAKELGSGAPRQNVVNSSSSNSYPNPPPSSSLPPIDFLPF